MAKTDTHLQLLIEGFRELYEKQAEDTDREDKRPPVVSFDEDSDKDKAPVELLRKAYRQK